MLPSDHAALPPTSWPRLARWLAPPWRALITWVVLASLIGAVEDIFGFDGILSGINWAFDQSNRYLPWPLHPGVLQFLYVANTVLFLTWFEPIILRLNLWRAVAWVLLRIGLLLCADYSWPYRGISTDAAVYLLWSVATVPLLHGRRTRPWASIPAASLSLIVWELLKLMPSAPPAWFGVAAVPFPYAAVMLYCTRLVGQATPDSVTAAMKPARA